MAKRKPTPGYESASAMVTGAALPCGRTITITPRRPGAFQLYRPLGEECEGCTVELERWRGAPFRPEYTREWPTGAKVGPICRPWAYQGQEESVC